MRNQILFNALNSQSLEWCSVNAVSLRFFPFRFLAFFLVYCFFIYLNIFKIIFQAIFGSILFLRLFRYFSVLLSNWVLFYVFFLSFKIFEFF